MGPVRPAEARLKPGLQTGINREFSDPAIQSLDSINFQAFTVGDILETCPEPPTLALSGLGAVAILIFRRRKPNRVTQALMK